MHFCYESDYTTYISFPCHYWCWKLIATHMNDEEVPPIEGEYSRQCDLWWWTIKRRTNAQIASTWTKRIELTKGDWWHTHWPCCDHKYCSCEAEHLAMQDVKRPHYCLWVLYVFAASFFRYSICLLKQTVQSLLFYRPIRIFSLVCGLCNSRHNLFLAWRDPSLLPPLFSLLSCAGMYTSHFEDAPGTAVGVTCILFQYSYL